MRTPCLIVTLALVAPVIAAAQAQPPTNGASAADVSPDEQQVRKSVVDFVELYNAHKADELAALFSDDASMVYRDGSEDHGREEIRQSFAASFEENPKAAISVVVDAIRILSPEVAIEEGVTTLFPDGQTPGSRGRYTVLHRKTDGAWRMHSVRVEEEESSPYGQLQALEWLVGQWVDEGRTEVVEANFHWDENKRFLLEEFQIVREGNVILKGTQRIGWDPVQKQIRSWIFDSEGGFGEVQWTKAGDDWICKASGVSAEGIAASATRRLVRPAPDRVLWTSSDRIAGGEVLPDLSVTMVRKPPQPK
jgi:uncharacterized protein (TIGR02246 family)